MSRLAAVMLLALVVLPAAVAAKAAGHPAAGPEEIRRIVVQEALRSARVPPSLALAVAEAESGFRANAESSAGARGVMQIMPATGRGEFGVEPDELWQPRLNIQLGIAFLDQLIARYGERWDLALSHYNGGSRVDRGAEARVIPATQGYVDKVLRLERRNARDEAVRRLVAAAEQAARPAPEGSIVEGPVTERLARAASRLALAEAHTLDWRPGDRRRRLLDLADEALGTAEARPGGEDPASATGSAALLERIDSRKQRFRALLATLRGPG